MSAILEPVGHEAIRAMLRGYAEQRGGAPLHHAWLFAGPTGVGKFRVARWWASVLKCPESGRCGGSCESCRLIAGAVHPDVIETRPPPKKKNVLQRADEEIERKKSFGVDDSRALLQRLSMRATRPGPRIAIVQEAHVMTVEAQNALLKTLEEPPGAAVLILVTDNIGAMLTTVRSRCRHLAFGVLSEDEVVRALQGTGWLTWDDEETARAAAACARGSVARAMQFDAEGLADREQLLLAWEAAQTDRMAIEPLVTDLASRKDTGYGLTDILEWQMAKIETALGRRAHEPSAELDRLLETARPEDATAMVERADRIQQAIGMIARNANPKLVIRDLLLNVRA